MKPSWNDAPEWAQWLARDAAGQWNWFEDKPYTLHSFWTTVRGKMERFGNKTPWQSTLEKRPQTDTKG